MAINDHSALSLALPLFLIINSGTGVIAQVNRTPTTQPQSPVDSTTSESIELVKKLSNMLNTMGYSIDESKDDGILFKIKNWEFYASSSKSPSGKSGCATYAT